MSRHCTICDHSERDGIDKLLVEGEPYRSIAKQFSLFEAAVYRHKSHLNGTLTKAKEAQEMAQADNLLNQREFGISKDVSGCHSRMFLAGIQ